MGLLDWLTDGAGSAMGGSSPPPGMPPMQDQGMHRLTETPIVSPLPPEGMHQATMSNIVRPRYPGSDGDPNPAEISPPMPPAPSDGSDGDALPLNAAPTGGTGLFGPPPALPPNAAPSLAPPPSTASGPLGRMLGLDRNRESQVRGSLGAGLKAAGENMHKPGLAAFAGSMGSGIEGGKTADDKTTDQQQKYLTQAIAAAQAGNTAALNIARTKLALAQAKAAEEGDPAKSELITAQTRLATARARKLDEGGGKANSVVNSPEQLYLRAIGATNSDGKLSLLKNAYIQASKDGQQDTPAAKAAKKAYEDAYNETRDAHLKTLGVDPKIASKIGKQPGFSDKNPVPRESLTTQRKFDELPVGAYFINPANGGIHPNTLANGQPNPDAGKPWLLIKQPPKAGAAGANPAVPAQSVAPAPPVPVTAPAGSAADREDDE